MNNYGLRVEYVEYTVQKGDSLYSIAKQFNTTVSELIDINMLTSNTIFPNQVLLVPRKNQMSDNLDFISYTIMQNDTVESIAEKQNVDPVLIGLYNDFGKIKLVPGQILILPRTNVYTIKGTDTIDSILANTNRTAEQLLRNNASNWLKSGSKINL